MSESCATCRFSAPVPDPKFPGLVECRRNPPVASARPVAGWPQTHPEGWCGEYQSKPAPARKQQRPVAGEVETRGEQG